MRPILATLAVLTLLTCLPSPAAAQSQGSVTVMLGSLEDAFTEEGQTLTFTGIVTLVADVTAHTSTTGIPVQYTVTKQPDWATVVVSPASDVFTFGAPTGLSVQASKSFTVTVALADTPEDDVSDQVEIAAQTSPAPFGASFTGKGATPIVYDAPDEPCPGHDIVTSADWASLAVEAADAYNEHHAAKQGKGEEVSVQTGGATSLSTPWIVVAGFAAVGAGVGLVLRRRLTR